MTDGLLTTRVMDVDRIRFRDGGWYAILKSLDGPSYQDQGLSALVVREIQEQKQQAALVAQNVTRRLFGGICGLRYSIFRKVYSNGRHFSVLICRKPLIGFQAPIGDPPRWMHESAQHDHDTDSPQITTVTNRDHHAHDLKSLRITCK